MSNRDVLGGEVYVDDLTWREQEILILLAERLTNREIAARLHLAESTVKDYVGKILSKLYVSNRRQAVERAKALGLLEGERKTVVGPAVNLPAEPTPFVGRRDELVEIKQRLVETRLLTLLGPGGIGKTRLALKAAREAVGDFEDGCFFVPLAPIRSVDHIVQTIAEAVKFPLATHENPQHQLLRYLEKRQLLLVMDNFEHVLDGAGIVSEIHRAAPAVKILATSRERLNLLSETVLLVGGMAFPDPVDLKDALSYDAITLFVQRAGKVRPGFEPSPAELGQVAKICQIVQGMPLAIELAAAWLHILNVDEIVDELEEGLDILATEMRDAPARHHSIRAVFDHSWALLDPVEREIFTRLSVFRGGFTRHAAQQVAGASLGQLAGFVDKSFLSHDPHSGRLEIHELLRQYAQERLEQRPQDSDSAQEAHAAYYAAFIQQRWEGIKGERQMLALAEIEADIENVRTAWRYYLDQRNAPQIWKFIFCLWYVYWIRSRNHAGMELFAQAARVLRGAEDKESVTLWALSRAFQGYFMAWLGLSERGYELAEESVHVLQKHDHPEALVLAYDSLSVNAYFKHQYAEEVEAIEKMVRVATEIGDKWLLSFTLFAAGMSALIMDNCAEAKRIAELNLNLNEEMGDVIGSTLPLIVLGHAALISGEYEQAREHYLRCMAISQRVGFHYAIQTSSKYLGKVTLSMGRIAEAEKYLLQSLTMSKEIGFVRDVVNLLYEFARLQVAQGHSERAVELLALVLEHPASYESRLIEGRIRDSAKDLLAKLEQELPYESYAAALGRGRESELEGVVADLIGPQRPK